MEYSVRRTLLRRLRPLDAIPVENSVVPGTPDINYRDGWIEVKVTKMPKKPDTPVRVPHFTQNQRLWLARRWQLGGLAFMVLKVGDTWLLLDGDVASEVVGKVPMHKLFTAARDAWGTVPSSECLREVLENAKYERFAELSR